MSLSHAPVATNDPDVLADAEHLSRNGWLNPKEGDAANDTAEVSLASTETRTVTLGAGAKAREHTFTVERKGPKLSPKRIKEAMAAAAQNQKPKIERPSVEALFDKFNQLGTKVVTMGNPEREVTVKTVEKRELDTSRGWEEPETRIEGLLSLDR